MTKLTLSIKNIMLSIAAVGIFAAHNVAPLAVTAQPTMLVSTNASTDDNGHTIDVG